MITPPADNPPPKCPVNELHLVTMNIEAQYYFSTASQKWELYNFLSYTVRYFCNDCNHTELKGT